MFDKFASFVSLGQQIRLHQRMSGNMKNACLISFLRGFRELFNELNYTFVRGERD
jgi:hypothetical protein